jgi:hypothetical protein
MPAQCQLGVGIGTDFETCYRGTMSKAREAFFMHKRAGASAVRVLGTRLYVDRRVSLHSLNRKAARSWRNS